MKKILFINQYGAPEKYHNFKRTSQLAKHFVAKGYIVTVLCSKRLHNTNREILLDKEVLDGVEFIYLNTIKYSSNFTRLIGMVQFGYKSFAYALFLNKFDIVVVSIQSIFAGFAGLVLSKVKKSRFILEVRDLWPETLIQFGKTDRQSLFSKSFRSIERILYKNADFIVPLFKNFKLYLDEKLKLKRHGEIVQINNGVAFDEFKRYEEIYTLNDMFSNSDINCLYTGSIGYANNIDLILDVADMAISKKTNFRFHIVGEGSMKNHYITESKKRNLHNVFFHQSLEYSQLPNLLSQADILLITTRDIQLYDYGISMNKIFDYLSSKTPVVGTTIETGDDIIGKSGWYSVKPNDVSLLFDTLEEIKNLSDSEINKKVCFSNNYIINNYTYKILSEKYISIFNRCNKY
jgi:glycosyltransferase involved in cell wall biosynthesis